MAGKYLTIGILAHVDAGKTTLSEGMLYLAGAIRNMGRVDHRDTFLDTYELERSRGITIFSKQAVFDYGGVTFTLLDTPGHSDFSPEMERTLQVLDMAVLIISARDGVTSQAKVLFKLLEHYRVPFAIFVNKMDQLVSGSGEQDAGIDESTRKELISKIKEGLGAYVVDFTEGTDRPDVQEELAVCDDALLEGFFEGHKITQNEVKELIRERKCFPCLFGSALKMEGVKELLDLIADYSTRETKGQKDAGSGAQVTDSPAAGAPEGEREDTSFGARVFKISREGQLRLTHMKITSGSLKIRDRYGDEKIDQIRIYSGDKYTAVQEATEGMICAVTGLSHTRAGQGLGNLGSSEISEILQPILSAALILPEEADVTVVYRQLQSLEEEEPMLSVRLNEVTGDIEVQIMGEVQKEILKHLLKTRFGLDVSFGPGHVVYKETIAEPAEGVGHFEPLRHYAEVHLLLEPAEPGSGIVIDNRCSTDVLSLNWQRLILTHIVEKKHVGVLTGAELTDVKITLLTGRAHEKHTEGGDFRQATYRAIRQGLMQTRSVLLEPVFDYRCELPQEFVGRAMSDFERMNGQVMPPEISGNTAILTGRVPAACLGDYASTLSAFTKGEGKLFTTLSGYAPCHNTREILDEKKYDPEADLSNTPDSVFCSHGAGIVIPWNEVPSYMHLPFAYSKGVETVGTDMTDSIDMDALKDLQARIKRNEKKERSFDEIEREIRATEGELKDIFERTYGPVKKRTATETTVYEGMTKEEKEARRDLSIEQQKRDKYQNEKGQDPDEYREYLLVDGYNIIYASDSLKELAAHDLKAARDALTDMLINFQGYRRERVILVFDAYRVHGGKEHVEEKAGLLTVYTKEAETADQYIEKAAHEIGKKYRVYVATSDAIEQVIVMGSGAIRLSARDILAEIDRTSQMITDRIETIKKL